MKKILATMLTVVMIFSLLPTNIAFATTNKVANVVSNTLKPGSTLNVTTIPEYYYLSTVAEKLYKYIIDSEGVYTLTGWEPFATRQVRFVVNKPCTIVLDSVGICSGLEFEDGTVTIFNGKGHGLFEIAQGINVNFVLKNDNFINAWPSAESGGSQDLKSILLNDNSTVTFSGSGDLYCNSIAKTVNGNGGGTANIVMNGGSLGVDKIGNIWFNDSDESWKYSNASNLKLTTNGYNFYNYADDDKHTFSEDNKMKTNLRATGDVYRVKIGVSNENINVKIADGDWKSVTVRDSDEKYYYYNYNGASNKPDIYIVDGNSYKHYRYTTASESATDVTSDKEMTTRGNGTVYAGSNPVSGATLNFKESAFSFSCSTGTDGKYDMPIPTGSYSVTAKLAGDNSTYDFGKIEINEEKNATFDFLMSVATGVVKDSSGATVSGADVTVEKNDGKISTVTDSNGKYKLFVPEGMKNSDGTITFSIRYVLCDDTTRTVTYEYPTMNADLTMDAQGNVINVYTEDDLQLLTAYVTKLDGKTINLMNDITVTGKFNGFKSQTYIKRMTFNGNGHTITGLTAPLFDAYTINYELEYCNFYDLNLKGNKKNPVTSSTSSCNGAIATYTYACVIDGCSFDGAITSANSAGGLAGYVRRGEVKNCRVTLRNSNCGGLVGAATKSAKIETTITSCYTVLEDSAADCSPFTTSSSGYTIKDCFYLKGGVAYKKGAKTDFETEKPFESGEIAYLLKKGQADIKWGQKLYGDDKETMPQLYGLEVFEMTDEEGKKYYANFDAIYTEDKYDLDGDGDFDGVFEISNAEELAWFGEYVNKNGAKRRLNAVLTNDIDLTGYEWTPIGVAGSDYMGIFDGQGHSVENMSLTTKENGLGDDKSYDYQGFFGVIRKNAEIRNVTVKGEITVPMGDINYIGGVVGLAYENSKVSNVKSYIDITDGGETYANIKHVGGVAGKLGNSYEGETAGFVENSSYDGTIDFNEAAAVGGIAGYTVYNSRVENCVANGKVGKGYIGHLGGIVGAMYQNSEIYKCVNNATVESTCHDCIGGIAGYAISGCYIENSMNTGSVSGVRPADATENTSSYVGGILGYINNSNFKGITNSLNIGKVTGGQTDAYTGGVIGWARNGADANTVKNVYYLEDTASKAFGSSGNSGGVQKATKDEIENGKVAYLLNGNQESIVWGQEIGKDEHPVLLGMTVYGGHLCSGKYGYTNDEADFEHNFGEDGICTKCGAKTIPLTEDKYDLDGDGNNDDCYEIGNLSEWEYFTSLVNKAADGEKINAVLTANIDMTGYDYIPVGDTNNAYTGIFDGRGFEITGWKLNPTESNSGLFGKTDGAVIRNVSVKGEVNITKSGLEAIGAIVGLATGETIVQNVKSYVNFADDEKSGHVYRMGGVVARMQGGGTIEKCEYFGNVDLAYGSHFGGIVGSAYTGSTEKPNVIRECVTGGEMKFATSRRIGGILGMGDAVVLIEKCVNNASISITESDGINQAGGIVGCITGNATVKNCINTGSVTDGKYNSSLGGIAGMIDSETFGTMENCYSVGKITNTHTDGSEYWGEFVGCLKPESIKDKVKNNYYLSHNESWPTFGTVGFAGEATKMSLEKFKSGEVCYLLNADQSEIIFRQTIGEDDYPKFSGKTVTMVDGSYCNGINVTMDGTDKVTNGTIVLGVDNGDGNYSLPDNVVGYHVNEKFVDAGKYDVSDGDIITTVKFNVEIVNGAQVRYGGGLDENGKVGKGNGLRFIAQVDRSEFDGESYGMKIQAEASSNETDVVANKWQDDTTFSVAITDMLVSNYNRNYTATPFVKVKYDDGTEKTVYGTNTVTRSIYYVASGLMKTGGGSDDYTLAENARLYDVLNAYVNMVGVRMLLDSDGNITTSDKYTGDVFFNVESVKNDDGSFSVTVEPLTENFEYPVKIKDYWTEFVRINNNNSVVKNCISEVNYTDNGVTFKFEAP